MYKQDLSQTSVWRSPHSLPCPKQKIYLAFIRTNIRTPNLKYTPHVIGWQEDNIWQRVRVMFNTEHWFDDCHIGCPALNNTVLLHLSKYIVRLVM